MLGSGVFGTTYQAVIRGMNVAIKRSVEYNQDPAQFKNELKLFTLKHKNIVQLIGCANSNDFKEMYLVYELIEGETLNSRIEGLTWKDALKIIIGLANAILFLQQQKPPLIHSDISLDNIMVSKDGVVRLIDFGLCVEVGEKKLGGKLGYMHCEEDGRASLNTDVYSFGVIAAQILAKETKTVTNKGFFVNEIAENFRITKSIVSPAYGVSLGTRLKISETIAMCLNLTKLPSIELVCTRLKHLRLAEQLVKT